MKRNLYETVMLTNADKLTLHIDYNEFVILCETAEVLVLYVHILVE